jgi:outer membrane immunogenic protein
MKRKALLFSPLALIPAGTHDAVAAPRAPIAATMSPPAWTGFYLGLNLGGLSEQSTQTSFRPAGPGNNYCFGSIALGNCSTNSQKAIGVLGGGQIGYNFESAKWVFGVETDFDLSSAKKTVSAANASYAFFGPWTARNGISDFGTVRGRIGYDFDNIMPYVTGGLAYAKLKDSFSPGTNTGYGFSNTEWRTGYTVGGGIEVLLSRNISIRGEALFYDLGTKTQVLTEGGPFTPHFGLTNQVTGTIARFGINYLFH